MTQLLLIPDPRPLVERLGATFFRQVPQCPGVYLMRDISDTILYVGKAKNLRKRLAHYRVANPDRLPRRHLRLLRAVCRIELLECQDEAAALAREAELLKALRPRYNRAGTWTGPIRYLAWRVSQDGLELTIRGDRADDWSVFGPLGAGALPLRGFLARLLWSAIHSDRGPSQLPAGWFRGHFGDIATIPQPPDETAVPRAAALLSRFFSGEPGSLTCWFRERTAFNSGPFEITALNADLELLEDFATRLPRITSRKPETT